MTSKSAQKQVRVATRRRQRNKSVRSEIKTDITRAEKLIFTGDLKEAKKAVDEAVSSLDKAANKRVIHGNNASRRKSRLMKKLNQALTSASQLPEPEPETETESKPEAEPETKKKPKSKPKTKKTG